MLPSLWICPVASSSHPHTQEDRESLGHARWQVAQALLAHTRTPREVGTLGAAIVPVQ